MRIHQAAPARLGRGRRAAVACALLLILPALAQAMSIRELRTLEANEKDGKAYASYYLVGVMEGLREANDAGQRAGQKPLFCINGRRLEPVMARSLYQTELTRNADSYEADMPVQLVLSAALRNSYRCNP
ncbi:hypothetical protein QTI17_24650 [Variovorax sp. J31P179]|jgi:hypothetical protein|uniref:hypothetical protein n=1 Tax=Variovorax sp. J31P179 TaxID=3053508 RepID=UPI002576A686|nr:hypothetical protein [Variovorax sp. J31P179]MDM0083792.1 hypothetical protein [Variovorax sp. J31P179]